MVAGNGFQRFVHRLRQVLGVRSTETDVIAIFNEHLGQSVAQAVDVVGITLDVELAALIVVDRLTIRQLGSGAEAIQNNFFVVSTGRASFFAEDKLVLVLALIVDAIEGLVEQRLDDRAKLRTAHNCTSHGINLFLCFE